MARDLYYEPDNLLLPDEMIEELSEQEPTPFYIYDAKGIRETSQKIFDVFSWNDGYRQYFPVKAANFPGILRRMLAFGQGLLCTTGLEVELARRSGAQADKILYAPIFPTQDDLRRAVEEDIPMVIDSVRVAELLLKQDRLPSHLGLRYHPEKDVMVGTRIVARPEGYKFGMDTRELIRFAQRLKARGVEKIGLHCHLKSGVENVRYWGQLLKLLHTAAQKVQEKAHVEIVYYNLGGGVLPSKCTDPKPLEIATVAEYVRICAEQLQISQPIHTEFGRFAIGPHGVLISRVFMVKPFYFEDRPLAILDAGVNKIMKHVGNHMQFHISVVGRREVAGRRFYALCGPLSDSLDRLSGKYMLPELTPGELVALHGAGAYCASLDSNYSGTLRSAVYLYEDGALHCLRRGETQEDYFAQMVF